MIGRLKQAKDDAVLTAKASYSLAYDQIVAGQEKSIRFYDKYRKISAYVLMVAMALALMRGALWVALTLFCLFHVHILINQVWWKLVNMEHRRAHEEEGNQS